MIKQRNNRNFSFLISMLLIITGCGGGSSSNSPSEVTKKELAIYKIPDQTNDGWDIAHVQDVSIDEALINQLLEEIVTHSNYEIDSIAMVKNRKLILDKTFRTELDNVDRDFGNKDLDQHYMASVTKSFTSALIGIALSQSQIFSIDDKVLEYFSEYSIKNNEQRKYDVSIKNLLTMRHGFSFTEEKTMGEIMRSKDYVKAFLDLPMISTPGTKWEYSSAASIVLGDIVAKASNMTVEEYARQNLFTPLEINVKLWMKTPKNRANTGYGLWLSTRDMAKFGQLYLQRGQWNGSQVIPEEWVTLSTQKHVGLTLDDSFSGYGFQWWQSQFNVNNNVITTYSAVGNGGQFIIICPELDLVTVFTGHKYNSAQIYTTMNKLMTQFILPSVSQ